jgi:IS5 family transposase
VDALGNPTGFYLTPGQACDLDGADVLLENIAADTVLADKGYDADQRVIERLQQQGKTAVIPPKCNRKNPRQYDKELYKARHLYACGGAKPYENFLPSSSSIARLRHATIS